MNTIDLSMVCAGFNEPSHGSQTAFRGALEALSHPGRVIDLVPQAEIPEGAQASASGLLLALLDADSRLWLSPALATSNAVHWLVFHTNCSIVSNPAEADFAWIDCIETMTNLDQWQLGTDEYPDSSTTCLINVEGFENQSAPTQTLVLQGPGILETQSLTIQGITAQQSSAFIKKCNENNQHFPRGIDVFLCAPQHITGIPRTSKVMSSDQSSFIKA